MAASQCLSHCPQLGVIHKLAEGIHITEGGKQYISEVIFHIHYFKNIFFPQNI